VTPPFLSVHLELENPTGESQSIFLEKGRCFEIVNPTQGLQNAVLAENTELTIPPHQIISVDLPAFCLNKYRRMTLSRHDANVTPFLLSNPCQDQGEIWKIMERPAA